MNARNGKRLTGSPPRFTDQPTTEHFRREDSPDRRLLNLNDAYGYGVLIGSGAAEPLPSGATIHQYVGPAAFREQALRGMRDGRTLRPQQDVAQ